VSPFRPGLFRAHISLASHEMNTQPDLADQVEAFVRAVPAPAVPASFPATLVGRYEFRSAGGTGHWWETLTWRRLRTWALGAPGVASASGASPA
jgi:hypothetical protein